MINIAVFISGEGSNLRAINEACERGEIEGKVVLVIADRPCPGLKYAIDKKIPVEVIPLEWFHSVTERDSWNGAFSLFVILAAVDLICLAGFLKILSKKFVEVYKKKILNLHPGPLPLLAGKDPQRRALELGLIKTGNTIHIVTEKVDDDSYILARDEVYISKEDDENTLSEKLKKNGYQTYITAINKWIKEFYEG